MRVVAGIEQTLLASKDRAGTKQDEAPEADELWNQADTPIPKVKAQGICEILYGGLTHIPVKRRTHGVFTVRP